MWGKVKLISRSHPDPNVRKFAKSLLVEMNSGKRDGAKIGAFIRDFYNDSLMYEKKSNGTQN